MLNKSTMADLRENRTLRSILINMVIAFVSLFINGFGVAYTTAYSACSKYLNLFIICKIDVLTAVNSKAETAHGRI